MTQETETQKLFRKNNFKLLNDILDKDFGVIECTSVKDPECSIINSPIKNEN